MSISSDLLRDLLQRRWMQALLVVAGSFLLARLANLLLARGVARLVRRTATTLDDRIVALLRRPVSTTVVLVGLRLAARILAPPAGVEGWLVAVLMTGVVLTWIRALLRIFSLVLQALSRARVAWCEPRTLPLLDNMAKIVIFGGGVYALLVTWDLDVRPWLASAGVLGIAFGFAAKDTLANLFGGLFVIADAPYKIGDFIVLDTGERGQVTRIGLRSTRILTREDIEITVPNAQIASAKIKNESGGPWEKHRVTVNVGVAYGSDVDQVRQVLLEAARSVDQVAREPEPRVRFTEFGDSALIFRLLCWVERPASRGLALDALNTAVYKKFAQHGIQIPFPQRDLHLLDHSSATRDDFS
ncbi:MAG: mechanosensitive ion channel family protein [Acidobacteriota bacterium]